MPTTLRRVTSMSRQLVHPRDEIMQTMDRIYRYRMTTTSGGNLSIRDESGDIWISPARVDKGNLTRGDIVCVHADGSIDGLHPPSSEFPFHQAIYEARPDVNAIVHAHPIALVAFSICRQSPNTRLFHQAHSVCGKVGLPPSRREPWTRTRSSIPSSSRSCLVGVIRNESALTRAEKLPSVLISKRCRQPRRRNSHNCRRNSRSVALATGGSYDSNSTLRSAACCS